MPELKEAYDCPYAVGDWGVFSWQDEVKLPEKRGRKSKERKRRWERKDILAAVHEASIAFTDGCQRSKCLMRPVSEKGTATRALHAATLSAEFRLDQTM